MSRRFTRCFSGKRRKALITYIMACDPDYETSLKLLKALPDAGAGIIELGIPFSDPMADGPAIQAAAERALKAGASVKKVLAMVKEFREKNKETPIVLMGYFNPVFRYGVEKFVNDAVRAGVDGVIIVDLPPEEEGEFTRHSIPAGLALVKLTTPTTDDARARKILKNASGFVYYVSVTGITGLKSGQTEEIRASLAMLREHTELPIAVGFGIKTPQQAAEVAKIADGIVVGSAFVNQIKENLGNQEKLVSTVLDMVKLLSRSVN